MIPEVSEIGRACILVGVDRATKGDAAEDLEKKKPPPSVAEDSNGLPKPVKIHSSVQTLEAPTLSSLDGSRRTKVDLREAPWLRGPGFTPSSTQLNKLDAHN